MGWTLALWLGLLAWVPRASAALIVLTEFTNQTDVVPGKDLWRVAYHLSGTDFLAGEGFTVYFDHGLYADLTGPLPPVNPGWDMLLIQPDLGLPDDGFLDGLATVDQAALTEPFVVDFTWLGSGVPASQPFETYNTSGGFTVTGGGETSNVPEPAGMALLAAGAAMGFVCFRRLTGRK